MFLISFYANLKINGLMLLSETSLEIWKKRTNKELTVDYAKQIRYFFMLLITVIFMSSLQYMLIIGCIVKFV